MNSFSAWDSVKPSGPMACGPVFAIARLPVGTTFSMGGRTWRLDRRKDEENKSWFEDDDAGETRCYTADELEALFNLGVEFHVVFKKRAA